MSFVIGIAAGIFGGLIGGGGGVIMIPLMVGVLKLDGNQGSWYQPCSSCFHRVGRSDCLCLQRVSGCNCVIPYGNYGNYYCSLWSIFCQFAFFMDVEAILRYFFGFYIDFTLI